MGGMKWQIDNNVDIKNSIDEIAKRKVLVDIADIEKLNKHDIKYTIFTDEVRTAIFILPGKKHKRFNADAIKTISEDLKSMSIRNTAKKYDCSTATIQCIKKGNY